MIDIAERLIATIEAGERVALITLATTRGSTPRDPGARMAVRAGGGHLGTVGGGSTEGAAIAAGLDAISDGRPRWVDADLTEAVSEEALAPCGGTMGFAIRPFGPDLLPVLREIVSAADDRRKVRLTTCLSPEEALGALLVLPEEAEAPAGEAASAATTTSPLAFAGLDLEQASELAHSLASQEAKPGKPGRIGVGPASSGDDWSVLLELLAPPAVLLVCGGGHVALPLVKMGKILGFRVTVIDDRPEFANHERFAEADRVICAGFDEVFADPKAGEPEADAAMGETHNSYPVDERTYAVIVTRGHRSDYVCVRRLIERKTAYLGMIGSRRRVAGIRELLAKDGVSREALDRLFSPIGLDLGGRSPAEIAVAILAEIVLLRRGGSGKSLTLAGRP